MLFSQDCGWWQDHIDEVVKKAWQCINIIRAFKFKPDMASLEKTLCTFCKTSPPYIGGPIWDNCPKEIESRIESVQIEAMGIVKGAT